MRPLLLAGAFAACAGGTKQMTHARAASTDCRRDGDGVICADATVAELVCRTVGTPGPPPPRNESKSPRSCRAVGVRYADTGETIWLYRASGFDPDDPTPPRREKLDIARAYRVELSEDGRVVRYKTQTLTLSGGIETEDHAYSVLAGTLAGD